MRKQATTVSKAIERLGVSRHGLFLVAFITYIAE
jgi:hypothetical protein